MKIDIVRPSALAPADLEAWRALQGRAPAWDSPFLSPDWAMAVERAQGGLASGVRIARLTAPNGAQGFFSARLRGATAMPAGAPMCDYQGVVGAPGLDLDPRALLDALGADRLDFSHMLADQAAFAPFMRGHDVSHGVDLSAGYAAYLAERKAATGLFKDLDKRRRKAEREIGPVAFEALTPSDEAFESLVVWKRRLMRATGQTDLFDAGWTLRLLRDLIGRRRPDFAAGLFALRIDGQLAAVHLHLMGRQTVHAWLIGHDEAFDRVSPGLLLFQDLLRWMETGPYRYLDFGPGDYRFKHQFANARRAIGHGFVGRPSPAALAREAQYRLRAVAERMPLGGASALPGKAMRRLDLWRGLK